MKTCVGSTEMAGRKATGFQIEAVNGAVRIDLPPRIECNKIMTSRSEVPTPNVALAHAHLKRIAPHIWKNDDPVRKRLDWCPQGARTSQRRSQQTFLSAGVDRLHAHRNQRQPKSSLD